MLVILKRPLDNPSLPIYSEVVASLFAHVEPKLTREGREDMMATKADPKVVHSTFVLERNFSKPPAAVFAALSEPDKVRQWFTDEKTSETLEFSLRFAVGGTRRFAYRLGPSTPVAGMVIINDGHFQDIVPNERIVTATTMTSGDRRLEASLTTFELLPSEGGTDLICTVQGAFFEGLGPDPAGLIRAGWNGLLDRLVEAVRDGD
jgi:uncharacterized protein YndB with AHSA1/START domain